MMPKPVISRVVVALVVVLCVVGMATIVFLATRKGKPLPPAGPESKVFEPEVEQDSSEASSWEWHEFEVTTAEGKSLGIAIRKDNRSEAVVRLYQSIVEAGWAGDYSEETKARLLLAFHETCASPENLRAAPFLTMAIYFCEAGDFEQAEAFTIASIVNYPQDVREKSLSVAYFPFALLSKIYDKLGEPALAAKALEEAIAYKDMPTYQWRSLSRYLADAGDLEGSLAAYRKYVAVMAGRGEWWEKPQESEEHQTWAEPPHMKEVRRKLLEKKFEEGTFIPTWLPVEKAVKIEPKPE